MSVRLPFHPLQNINVRDAIKQVLDGIVGTSSSKVEVNTPIVEVSKTVVNTSGTEMSGTVVMGKAEIESLGYVEQSQTVPNTLQFHPAPTYLGDKLFVPPGWALPPPSIDKVQEIRDRAAKARATNPPGAFEGLLLSRAAKLGGMKHPNPSPELGMQQEAPQRSLAPRRKIDID